MPDVRTAVVQAALRTGTGTQDFTSSGFGTCKLALFFATRCTANGTPVDHDIKAVGGSDGERELMLASSAENGVGTSNNTRYNDGGNLVLHITDQNGDRDGECTFNSFITDGVRINVTNSFDGQYLVNCILFGGDDLDVYLDNIDPADSGGTTNVTAPGFEPDVVLFFANGLADGFTDNDNRLSVGFAENRGTIKNRAIAHDAGTGEGTSDASLLVSDTRCVLNLEGGSLSRSHAVTAFGASGFSITHYSGDSSSSVPLAYVALKFGGLDYWIDTITTPTATGDNSQTGPGFTPQLVLMGMSDAAAVNTIYGQGEQAISMFTPNAEYCIGWSDEYGETTMDTQSLIDDQAVYFADDAGSIIFNAVYKSMDANGWTLTYSSPTPAARKWIAFAIEEAAAAGGNIEGAATASGVGAATATGEITGEATGSSTASGVGTASATGNLIAIGSVLASGVGATTATATVTSGAATLDQEGYRWRNDDGDEIAATWTQLQDVNDTIAAATPIRLRVLIDSTGNYDSAQFQLEYREVGVGTWSVSPSISPSAEAETGLEWDGNESEPFKRRCLYWTSPFDIYDATYIFRVYPKGPKDSDAEGNYWTMFFWGNFGTFPWDGGGGNTYYGAHPYPFPSGGAGTYQGWEISANATDIEADSPYDVEVDWDRWYTQVFRAWREDASNTHHEFYWDWPNQSKVISYDINDSGWADQDPPTPSIVVGQCAQIWGGTSDHEEYKGIIRGMQFYDELLSLANVASEFSSPGSVVTPWYLKINPTPTDVEDDSGNNNDPSWDGSDRPTLWEP